MTCIVSDKHANLALCYTCHWLIIIVSHLVASIVFFLKREWNNCFLNKIWKLEFQFYAAFLCTAKADGIFINYSQNFTDLLAKFS